MKVSCPYCSQEYDIDESRIGTFVQCATCSESFEIPEPTPIVTKPCPVTIDIAPPPKDQGQKTCPMCGERILYIAKKCRYCGTILDGTTVVKEKDQTVYVILALFAGGLGLHNFYAGRNNSGLINLCLTVLALPTFGVAALINLVLILGDIIKNPNGREDAKGYWATISMIAMGIFIVFIVFNALNYKCKFM